MPFDAFVLHCVAGEIEETLIAGRARITKIYQINSTELLIHFRGEFKNHTLLLSTHPSRARLHLTTQHYASPSVPPPFCMLLRKHLIGASITSLEQAPLERVLKINLRAFSPEGRVGQKALVVEIMERRSNLILLDEPDEAGKQVIMGAIKAVPPFMNRFRTVLPHHQYVLPPPQDKIHPYSLDYNFFKMEAAREEGRPAADFLLNKLRGFSPFIVREIVLRTGADVISEEAASMLWEKMQDLLQQNQDSNWEPTMLCDGEGRPQDFAAFVPQQADGIILRRFQSMSQLLDDYYLYRQQVEEKFNLQKMINRQVGQIMAKARKREKIQIAELEKAESGDRYRLYGELLNMNLHAIPHKADKIMLQNLFSEEGEMIKITLDPRLSPSENAQRYFKKYRKAGNALKSIAKRLNATRQEIVYLESILYNTENSDWHGLQEIKGELEEAGYLPAKPKASGSVAKNAPFKPHRYKAREGEEILVGRNNRQNDLLLRQGAATDLWFHVKDMPGAHVILKEAHPSTEAVEAAAMLAASHSRGAHSANVPVDYTAVKNVRRIPGAGLGMVTYTNYRTLFITPDEQKIKALLHP